MVGVDESEDLYTRLVWKMLDIRWIGFQCKMDGDNRLPFILEDDTVYYNTSYETDRGVFLNLTILCTALKVVLRTVIFK